MTAILDKLAGAVLQSHALEAFVIVGNQLVTLVLVVVDRGADLDEGRVFKAILC